MVRISRFLIAPYFGVTGVRQPRAVIDGDVDRVPADRPAALDVAVGDGAAVVLAQAVKDAFAGAAWMRPSFLTSIWISSPGRSRS